MSKTKSTGSISAAQQKELLATLKTRFEKNMNRHTRMSWDKVAARLEKNADKLWSLFQMETTQGEPDVVDVDKKTGEFIFFDCAPESPKGRRSVCYDVDALESRKEHKPKHSAIGMANEMGTEILDEEQYRFLQELGKFDLKT